MIGNNTYIISTVIQNRIVRKLFHVESVIFEKFECLSFTHTLRHVVAKDVEIAHQKVQIRVGIVNLSIFQFAVGFGSNKLLIERIPFDRVVV